MTETSLTAKSLCFYKNFPAQILEVTPSRLEIVLQSGEAKKVRDKDILVYSPESFKSWKELESHPPVSEEDLLEATALLEGKSPSIADITELICGDLKPTSLYQTAQALLKSPNIRGPFSGLQILTQDQVEKAASAEKEKQNREALQKEFLERLSKGTTLPTDRKLFNEIENVAWGGEKQSSLLRAMKVSQTPENAHRVLLDHGVWDIFVNPYLRRNHVSLGAPKMQGASLELPEEEREDLTFLQAFAIDDEGSNDADDAISLDGHTLWVHIADVGALVSHGSPLDLEACGRASNMYLPEGTIPMLPREITQRLALGLTDRSPAFSFRFELSEDFESVSSFSMHISWIKVTKITYEDAQKKASLEPFAALFKIAALRRKYRVAQGAVSFNFPEILWKVSLPRKRIMYSALVQVSSRDMVMEMMLLVGEQLALWAYKSSIPLIYACQKLKGDVPPRNSAGTYEVLSQMFAARKQMARSVMSTEHGFHVGLGLPFYTRATSPLRRYPDLLIMQQIRAWVKHGSPILSQDDMTFAISQYEENFSHVLDAMRRTTGHWRYAYLWKKGSWEGDGIFIGERRGAGVFFLTELGFEVTLNSAHLKDFELDEIYSLKCTSVDVPMQDATWNIVS